MHRARFSSKFNYGRLTEGWMLSIPVMTFLVARLGKSRQRALRATGLQTVTYRNADDKVLSVETGMLTDPYAASMTVTSRVDTSYIAIAIRKYVVTDLSVDDYANVGAFEGLGTQSQREPIQARLQALLEG